MISLTDESYTNHRFLLELASKPPNVFYDLWLSLSSAHSSLWLTLRLSRERPLRLSVIEYQSTPDGGRAGGRIRGEETPSWGAPNMNTPISFT